MHELPSRPDPEAIDRVRAAVIAGHRGDRDHAMALFGDPDPVVREAALGALARIGDLGADRVRAGFADPAPRVRARAAEVALLVDGVDPSELLEDPDSSVVEVACFACGEQSWPDGAPTTALAEIATRHDDPLCREAAAAALGAIGDPAGLDAVLVACGDRVTVRRRATLALAAFDDPRVDDALRLALDDKDWQVRQAAEDLLSMS